MGARFLRLDPWYFTKTDFQIKLCHSGADIIPEMIPQVAPPCAISPMSLGKKFSLDRSFIFAIKEIAHWLRLHPSEFMSSIYTITLKAGAAPTDQIQGLIASGPGQATQIFISTQAVLCPCDRARTGRHGLQEPSVCREEHGRSFGPRRRLPFPSLRQLRTIG